LCDATLIDPADFEALAWLDAFERSGGRVICDGRMFAITPPSEDCGLEPPGDLMALAFLAYRRDRRRLGLEP
jgi:hypothetical protein